MEDLKAHGLLDSTLIVWTGEFGRTPQDHAEQQRPRTLGNAWSTVLAGGGIRGGQVIGRTSEDGDEIEERPVIGAGLHRHHRPRDGHRPEEAAHVERRPAHPHRRSGRHADRGAGRLKLPFAGDIAARIILRTAPTERSSFYWCRRRRHGHGDDIPRRAFRASGVSWAEYLAFSDSLGERHVRVTYDRGEMEFMTISPLHDRIKHVFVLLLGVLSEEMNISVVGYGSMTQRREDLERGLEADECYWIEHAELFRGRTDVDLRRDPPPDLAIEVEISRSTLDRMGISAALGVPEVWRCDGETLRVCLLGAEARYADAPHSRAFPFLPMEELLRFVQTGAPLMNNELLRHLPHLGAQHIARSWSGNG